MQLESLPISYPDCVDPYDPVIKEATNGIEDQILGKAKELIESAGVASLPDAREGPTALIMGGDSIVQAFSSSSDGIVFQTYYNIRGRSDRYVRDIGDGENIVFYIYVRPGNDEPYFIELYNPVNSATYARLRSEEGAPTDEDKYTAERFRNERFLRLSTAEVSAMLAKYLLSTPRKDLADIHYDHLTGKGTRIPGGGRVVKLY